jgi:Polysaccharide lyase family 4, domain II
MSQRDVRRALPSTPGVLLIALAVLLIAGLTAFPTGSAGGYEAGKVTDGGTIQGKVVFQGSPPPKRKVIPTKDREVCGSAPREVDQILLGGDQAVQEAVVYLKKVDKGKAWEKAPKPPEINNSKCEFQPHVQVIPVGDIEIVNSDPVLHNTHGFLDRLTVFNVALPNQGQRIAKPLKKPGLVRVECDAHGWMLGWIYVAENPYYAVTGKDGAFTIKDVPPGAYTLVGWQEFTGAVEVPVTVKAKEVVTVPVELKKK